MSNEARSSLVLLVRHGACDASGPLSGGRFDPPLNENGRAQVVALAARLADLGVGVCLSSPLRRARETAGLLTEAIRPRLRVEVIADLAEYHRGDFETPTRNGASTEAFAHAWRDGRWEAWPHGDTRASFRARTDALVGRLRRQEAAVTLVVTHGGVINEVLSSLLELDRGQTTAFHPAPSSLTVLKLDVGLARLLLFGDVWHLDDPLAVLPGQLSLSPTELPGPSI